VVSLWAESRASGSARSSEAAALGSERLEAQGTPPLLVETDLTVEEIGRKVGYADPVYFTRSFRRTNGATPLRWRRAGRP